MSIFQNPKQQHDLDRYACLSLSQDLLQFTDTTDFSKLKITLYESLSTEILEQHERRDTLNPRRVEDALWKHFHRWYLFKEDGSSRYTEPAYNVNNLLFDLLNTKKRGPKTDALLQRFNIVDQINIVSHKSIVD